MLRDKLASDTLKMPLGIIRLSYRDNVEGQFDLIENGTPTALGKTLEVVVLPGAYSQLKKSEKTPTGLTFSFKSEYFPSSETNKIREKYNAFDKTVYKTYTLRPVYIPSLKKVALLDLHGVNHKVWIDARPNLYDLIELGTTIKKNGASKYFELTITIKENDYDIRHEQELADVEEAIIKSLEAWENYVKQYNAKKELTEENHTETEAVGVASDVEDDDIPF